jgi:hypothetical protein
MEQTWKLSGIYFDWEMTLRVVPGESPPFPIEERHLRDALDRMRRLDDHFTDQVSLYEYGMD